MAAASSTAGGLSLKVKEVSYERGSITKKFRKSAKFKQPKVAVSAKGILTVEDARERIVKRLAKAELHGRLAGEGKLSLKYPAEDEIFFFQSTPDVALSLLEAMTTAMEPQVHPSVVRRENSSRESTRTATNRGDLSGGAQSLCGTTSSTAHPRTSGTSTLSSTTTGRQQLQQSASSSRIAGIASNSMGLDSAGGVPRPLLSGATRAASSIADRLNVKQRKVMAMVRGGVNVFVTGGAGVGKSHLVEVLTKLFGDSRNGRCVVTASTGIAAMQLGGVTLHRFGGIRDADISTEAALAEVAKNSSAVSRWQNVKLLFVDEISMVDGRLLDKLDAIARTARGRPSEPFGGVQVVLSGDFLQLPPVPSKKHGAGSRYRQASSSFSSAKEQLRGVKTESDARQTVDDFRSRYTTQDEGDPSETLTTTTFAFEASCWSSLVQQSVVLTEVFRQRESTFVDLLNLVRLGQCDDSAARQLLTQTKATILSQAAAAKRDRSRQARRQSRRDAVIDPHRHQATTSREEEKQSTFALLRERTRLFALRSEVDSVNVAKQRQLPGEEFVFLAEDTGDKHREWNLDRATPARSELRLKVGSEVVLIRNLDSAKGLVNGARGVVASVDNLTKELKVRWHSAASGSHVTAVERSTFSVKCGGEVVASRRQLPLDLAWALSIHKSQGMTLNSVELSFRSIFEAGQAYVGLSRAKSLSGLIISGVESIAELQQKIHCNGRALKFVLALAAESEDRRRREDDVDDDT